MLMIPGAFYDMDSVAYNMAVSGNLRTARSLGAVKIKGNVEVNPYRVENQW